MSKLIARYVADPSAANAKRVAAHYHKHPFAGLMLTAAESAVLIQALSHEDA
jgi:hypothetical protein